MPKSKIKETLKKNIDQINHTPGIFNVAGGNKNGRTIETNCFQCSQEGSEYIPIFGTSLSCPPTLETLKQHREILQTSIENHYTTIHGFSL